MNADITNSTDTTKTLTITMDETALKPIAAKTFDDLRPRVKASGFRPGKAPDNVIERELGAATVQSEILEAAVTASYVEAVRKHDLAVVASPSVNITKFVPYTELEYTATVDIMPEIKLPDYKKMKKKRESVEVTDAEVDDAIKTLRERMAKKLPVERAAKVDDEVTFDFEGKKDGELVPGASAKNHTMVLGSKTFIPGFEEALIGLKKGDTKTFDIRFPKDYNEQSLANKIVSFSIVMHQVNEQVLPAVDDEFAATVGPFKSADELLIDARQQLEAEKREAVAKKFEDEIVKDIAAKTSMKVPEALVARQLATMKDELAQQLSSMGLDFEKYVSMSGKDEAAIEKEMRPQAENRVKTGLVISEIAKQEGIEVKDAEIHAEIDRLKEQYPDPAMQAELDKHETHDEIGSHLMASRTLAKLVDYIEG